MVDVIWVGFPHDGRRLKLVAAPLPLSYSKYGVESDIYRRCNGSIVAGTPQNPRTKLKTRHGHAGGGRSWYVIMSTCEQGRGRGGDPPGATHSRRFRLCCAVALLVWPNWSTGTCVYFSETLLRKRQQTDFFPGYLGRGGGNVYVCRNRRRRI